MMTDKRRRLVFNYRATSPRPTPRGRGRFFWGGLYSSAQDLERFDVFWKRFVRKRQMGGHFSAIDLHGMKIGGNNGGRRELGLRCEA
jgi:hypothetical protein